MIKQLYIIKLEQDKYLIHFDNEKTDKEIILECEIYYDYAKKYKPLSIIEKNNLLDFFDIDKTVKYYMYLYGYANVRGGSYIDEELPDYLEKTLNKELDFLEKEELDYSYLLNEIIDKYIKKNFVQLKVRKNHDFK